MRRTVTIWVDVEPVVLETIEVFNQAVNDVLQVGLSAGTYNKYELQKLTYYDLRAKYGLQSSLTLCAKDVASEILKREFRAARKAGRSPKLPTKRNHGAVRYNARTFSFKRSKGTFSFSVLGGRWEIPAVVPEHFRQYLSWNIKAARISHSRRRQKLCVQIIAETSDPPLIGGNDCLGIDLGIWNTAVTSGNTFHGSKMLRNVIGRYQHNRNQLQSKGTRAAKRKLRQLSGREKRFRRDVNHCVAKKIVTETVERGKGAIAFEKLTTHRHKKLGKRFNRTLGKWSWALLQELTGHKATATGIRVVFVDPRYTSQRCSYCGDTKKSNRCRHNYYCPKCGLRLHSDLNAARNIAEKGNAALGRLSSTSQTDPLGSKVAGVSPATSPFL